MQPYLQDLSGKGKLPIRAFSGINTGISPLLIEDGQAEDMCNLDTRDYPLLKTRTGREVIAELSGEVRYLGSILGETLTAVEGNVWKSYDFDTGAWTNIKTGMSGTGRGESIEFVDQTIYVNGTTNYYRKHDTGAVGTFEKMPPVKALALSTNKLFGIEGMFLHYSGLRQPHVWNDPTKESSQIEVETPNGEELSAITEFSGYIVCFKPHSTHELYGNRFANFDFNIVSDTIGCMAQRSICKVKTQMFWLGAKSVYRYIGGSSLADIGATIKRYIDNAGDMSDACAGSDGERYYLSLPQKDGKNILLVYDTRTGIWTAEDDAGFIDFTIVKNELYGLSSDGKIYKMVSDTEDTVDWHWHSKWFSSGTPSEKQNWYGVYITAEGEGSINVDAENNKGQSAATSERVYAGVLNGGLQIIRVNIGSAWGHNSDWLQLKISGTGNCKIHSIERDVRTRKGTY